MDQKKPTIISMINLKGGVGKTTTLVALAEHLAMGWGHRVLVIDLDPQTNATIAFIPPAEWKARNDAGQTLSQMFKDRLENTSVFDIEQAILKNVSKLDPEKGLGGVDLLPSSIDLIDLQDSLLQISQQSFFGASPIEVVKNAIAPVKNDYDFILIDCPPNLGTITLNGILISDYYIIPTIPDHLSSYGIPQILNRVNRFKKNREECTIEPLGIVANLVRPGLLMHANVIAELEANERYPRVFHTLIPQSVEASRHFDPEFKPTSLTEKYRGAVGSAFSEFVKEVLHHVQNGSE